MANGILNNKHIVNASIILMGLSILTVIMYQFKSFLMPFTVSMILSFLLVPLTRLFKRKKIMLIYSGFGLIVIIMGIIIISSLAEKESKKLDITNSTETITDKLELLEGKGIQLGETFIGFNKVSNNDTIRLVIQKIISFVILLLRDLFSQFALVLLFLIFMLPSHDRLIQNLSKKIPPNSKKRFKTTINNIEKGIRDYLVIKSLISGITAIVSLIVILIFGVKYPILFMLLIFFLNFIPNIGSVIAVGIILIAQLLAVGFSTSFIILAILLIGIQITMGNIIEPKISGKKMNLSPIVILLSLFFWGFLWGAWGMFFAVPLTVTIKIILENLSPQLNKNS